MSRRVAIVHDWLNGMRGGEKVLEVICELFPGATVFTLFHEPSKLSPLLRGMNTRASLLNRFAFTRKRYRFLLPLFPWAVEQFDLSGFDLVISSSHCVAKGAIAPKGVPHLCYCHSPMRYVWDLYGAYFSKDRTGPVTRLAMRFCRPRLRRWDVASASRVSRFIANSRNVAAKIERYYGRGAQVIHPPVDWDFYHPTGEAPRDYYLVCSAMVPYKRVEIAIGACRRLRRRLIVAGEGSERPRLERLAAGSAEFAGRVSDETLRALYAGCRALLFPGEEDFGITPLEAMSCGRPVIAFTKGGALETVVEGETGLFFDEPSPQSMASAIERFETMTFNADRLRAHAKDYARPLFRRRLAQAIERAAPERPMKEDTG